MQGRLAEAERRVKSVDAERQQLQDDLDDVKDALQAETTRNQALLQQFEKIKLENDKRLSEKDDELDAQRASHRRQLESLQNVNEESDNKNKSELAALKKKLSGELEDALQQLEVAKKSKADLETNLKKLQITNKVIIFRT